MDHHGADRQIPFAGDLDENKRKRGEEAMKHPRHKGICLRNQIGAQVASDYHGASDMCRQLDCFKNRSDCDTPSFHMQAISQSCTMTTVKIIMVKDVCKGLEEKQILAVQKVAMQRDLR